MIRKWSHHKVFSRKLKILYGGQGGIRTPVGIKPRDLQSRAFDRSATYP